MAETVYEVDLFEDENISDEPCDEDAFIVTRFACYEVSLAGKYLGRAAMYDDAEALITAEMDRQQYFPNVWLVSDHGNYELVNV